MTGPKGPVFLFRGLPFFPFRTMQKSWQEFDHVDRPETRTGKASDAAAGRRIPVVIKRNARARRLILRVDEALGLPVLTLPPARRFPGRAFPADEIELAGGAAQRLSPAAPFADGACFRSAARPAGSSHAAGAGIVTLERRKREGYVLSVPGRAGIRGAPRHRLAEARGAARPRSGGRAARRRRSAEDADGIRDRRPEEPLGLLLVEAAC